MKKILFLMMLGLTLFATVIAKAVDQDTTSAIRDSNQAVIEKQAPVTGLQAVQAQMDDTMRSSGKIYVVIGTISIIFVGLAIYLFAIDRRLKKLEK
jgi:CcmD family protein